MDLSGTLFAAMAGPLAALWGATAVLAAAAPLPMERAAWEKYQPLGGEFEDGRYVQRRDGAPCFELSRLVPASSNIVVEAVVTPERAADGASSGTLGVVVWEGHFRWRRLGLTLGTGGRHSFELVELRDGARMPESDLPAEPAGRAWAFGEPVTLRLALGDGVVEGEARAADGTLLFHRRLPIKPGAVASGLPGFSLYRLHGRFDSFAAEIGAPLPDTRDEARHYAPFNDSNGAYFRSTRDDAGKWWFVDPAGNRMFLSGIGVANYRGHYSAALGYAPYYRTVQAKYSTLEDWATNTLRRVGDWGFNFLSSPSANLMRRGFPHASVVNHGMGQNFACYGDEFDILPCDGGPCSGFPDVFHPFWPAYCRFAAQSFCRAEREDPWLLGWYIDNELSWWGDKRQFKTPPASGLFDAAAKKAPGHPARQALEAFLAEHGHAGPASAAPAELKREFVRLCARKYFEAATAAIREADPNHLILGCRFAGLPSADPVVWEECGRFCDAVSVNIYPMADLDRGVAVDWPGPNARLMSDLIGERARMAGKPVIVTEWSFSALDSGLPCTHGAGKGDFSAMLREYSRGGVCWTAAVEARVFPPPVPSGGTRDFVFRGDAASGPFEVAMRFYEPAGAPFFLAELLSVRNGGDRPLPFDAVFFRVMPLDREGAEAARGDDAFEPPKEGQPTPIPPMLWRPWRSGAWILPDGTALGLLSPRQTGVQIRFWKDSALHSDAEMRYPYRTLAPGETWAPEHRPFVIGGTASGGESGWREFCNEVKRIENTAR